MVLCLDIGGTHIRIAEVIGKKIKNKKVMATPKNKEELVNILLKSIGKYSNRKEIKISIAGFVKNNEIIKTPNLNLSAVDLKGIFKHEFKSKVLIENDAKCAALAELKFGSIGSYKHGLLITIGTGIGGAIIVDKKLYHGNGFAGEFGHMNIDGEEFEDISSGTSLDALAKEAGIDISTEMLSKNAQNKDPIALKMFDIIIESLSKGLLNLVYAFDPQFIVIGGAFSKNSFLLPRLKEKLKIQDLINRDVEIIFSELGEDASLIGASLLRKVNS